VSALNNLIADSWIRARRRSGVEQLISPSRLTDRIADDPVVEIVSYRPDFRSAIYQFLIGLLQTACMPADERAWLDSWNRPPSPEHLSKKMNPFIPAFNVSGEGPLFMQDASVAGQGLTRIGALLIDEPGIQSAKLNKDHFVKRNRVSGLSPAEALAALITMQCMAPSGGKGNRTSLRGGGPLTTLLISANEDVDSLWHRLWLNVLDSGAWMLTPGRQGVPIVQSDVFPWMGSTRVSDAAGQETTPEDAHSLQHYWAMPRRILLGQAENRDETCSFSGTKPIIVEYASRPWGVNYVGPWRHPLSPHYRDEKSGDFLPVHPQPGGFQYQLWAEWAQPPTDESPSKLCAAVVTNHLQSQARCEIPVRLWASGYDMDNMKPRCFYETSWPLFHYPPEHALSARTVVVALAAIARSVAATTRSQVKEAWLRRPGDHSDSKNNMSAGVASRVYEGSEEEFFVLLSRLHASCSGNLESSVDGEGWRNYLSRLAHETFDIYVPVECIADGDPGRMARARNGRGCPRNG